MKHFSSVFLLCLFLFSAVTLHAYNQHVVTSSNLHCNDTVAVFSPEGGSEYKSVPTVFLLHGHSGCWSDWVKKMDLQALCNETGFRIICPDGFRASWYLDNADASKMQWRKFFWEELWPLMDSKYGLSSDKTFITGLSMGGHGAMNLFLDHPDRFAGAGSMSGVLDLKYSSHYEAAGILGASSIEDPAVHEASAVARLGRVSEVCGDEGLRKVLVVTCGTSDKRFYPASREFFEEALSKGLRTVGMFSPATHSWKYWTWVVRYHISIFRDSLSGKSIGD